MTAFLFTLFKVSVSFSKKPLYVVAYWLSRQMKIIFTPFYWIMSTGIFRCKVSSPIPSFYTKLSTRVKCILIRGKWCHIRKIWHSGQESLCVDTNVFSCPRMPSHLLRRAAMKTSFCLSSFFICYRTRVAAKPQTTKKKVSLIKYTMVLLMCLKKHAHFKANRGRRHIGEPPEKNLFQPEAFTLRTQPLWG